jgi:hypothetical protein
MRWGIAGTQASGLMAAQDGAMVKRMHAGRASQSGLYGALLAERGFTGIVSVFESDYGGFCSTFSRSHHRFDLAQLKAGLDSSWHTLGIPLKFYSCVGSNHTTLDAIRPMQAQRPFGADEVKRIRRARLAGHDGPRRLEAFSTAATLLGRPGNALGTAGTRAAPALATAAVRRLARASSAFQVRCLD